jgi:hypothetical protein
MSKLQFAIPLYDIPSVAWFGSLPGAYNSGSTYGSSYQVRCPVNGVVQSWFCPVRLDTRSGSYNYTQEPGQSY